MFSKAVSQIYSTRIVRRSLLSPRFRRFGYLALFILSYTLLLCLYLLSRIDSHLIPLRKSVFYPCVCSWQIEGPDQNEVELRREGAVLRRGEVLV